MILKKKTRCLFCEEAPCTKACGKGNPARAIRAIRFDNSKNAGKWLEGCSDADLERAEQACIHYDRPIRIRELLKAVECEPVENNKPLPSLAITFCGIPCENPFFLASSAVCSNYDMVARALEMGWAGVFYKTICKQDIHEVSPRFDAVKEGTAFAGFRNMEQLSENPLRGRFRHSASAEAELSDQSDRSQHHGRVRGGLDFICSLSNQHHQECDAFSRGQS